MKRSSSSRSRAPKKAIASVALVLALVAIAFSAPARNAVGANSSASAVSAAPARESGWTNFDLTAADWESKLRDELVRLKHPDPDEAVRKAKLAIAIGARFSPEPPKYVSRVAPSSGAPRLADRPLADWTQQLTPCSWGGRTNVLVSFTGPAFSFANWYGLSLLPPFAYAAGPSITYGGNPTNLALAFISNPWYETNTSVYISAQYDLYISDMWCS